MPRRDWLIAQFAQTEAADAVETLAGRPAAPQPDPGPVVCVCFAVGLNTIATAIAEQSLMSVAAVGAALSAVTNCGSCRPAIQHLIGQTRQADHA